MAKNPKEAMGQGSDAARNAADQMQAAGERMKAAADSVGDAGSRLGLKMLDQAETNTNEAFKAMRAAAQANDISEIMRIQTEYLREQGSRSVGQVREIGEIIADFGRNTIGQVTKRG